MRKLVLVFMVFIGLTSVSAAHAVQDTTWYWNPASCKAQLQAGGVELADGRYFYVAKAFCVGKGGAKYCEWNASHSSRDYAGFYVVVRSYDGNVRTFDLYPTGRGTWRGQNTKVYGKMSAAAFSDVVSRYATLIAHQENQKGCAPYSG
jgi:hypothetical protein